MRSISSRLRIKRQLDLIWTERPLTAESFVWCRRLKSSVQMRQLHMKRKARSTVMLTCLSCLIVLCPPALSRDRQKEMLNIQAHQIWAAQHGMYLPGAAPGYITPYDDEI